MSMPHPGPSIGSEHVNALRRTGPGSLLVWNDEHRFLAITAPGIVHGPEALIIAGYGDLSDPGAERRDACLAEVFAQWWRERGTTWPQAKAMAAAAAPLRHEFAQRGVYLRKAPDYRCADQCGMTDHYLCPQTPGVVMSVDMTAGSAEPGPVRLAFHRAGSRELIQRISMRADSRREAGARTIASAAEERLAVLGRS